MKTTIDRDLYTTLAEIAEALKISKRSVERRANKEGWSYQVVPHRGNDLRLYALADLPKTVSRAVQALREWKVYEQSPECRAGQEIARQMAEESARKAAAKAEDEEALLALVATATGEKGERLRAWVATLLRWKRFYQEHYADKRRSKKKALNAFVAAFNARQLELDDTVVAVIFRSSGRGRSAVTKGLSLRTLEAKLELLERGGIGALLDHYGNRRKGESQIHAQPALEHYVLGVLAHQPDVQAGRLRELALVRFAARTDIRIPSESAFRRYVDDWKTKNASAHLYLRNPDAWKNQVMPAVGRADGDVVRLNQRWELDSTLGDVLLSDGKRHAVIGVIDVYSRRSKLLVAPTSKARAIAALMRRALLDWGVPEVVKTDNGADYTSDYLAGVLDALKIEQVLCPPFSPEYKPHIERFLGTFNHDLVELLPGYIGHDVAERKAIEARRSFAQRLMEKDGVLEVRLSPEELQTFCDDWVENRYHHQAHDGIDGETPFQRAAAYRGEVRRIRNERALDILLSPPVDGKTRTLGKKGLEIHGGFYSDPELWRHHSTGAAFRVFLDETDLGRAYVYDAEGFVCVAICPERLGLSPEEVRRHAMACKRMAVQQRNEEVKKLRKAKAHVNLNEQIQALLRAEAEAASKLAAFPQPSAVHTTPALEGAAQAARAIDEPLPAVELPPDLMLTKRKMEQRAYEIEAAEAVSTLPQSPVGGAVHSAMETRRAPAARPAPAAGVSTVVSMASDQADRDAKDAWWKERFAHYQAGGELPAEEIRMMNSWSRCADFKARRRRELNGEEPNWASYLIPVQDAKDERMQANVR